MKFYEFYISKIKVYVIRKNAFLQLLINNIE